MFLFSYPYSPYCALTVTVFSVLYAIRSNIYYFITFRNPSSKHRIYSVLCGKCLVCNQSVIG
jgi:hypothetical protein